MADPTRTTPAPARAAIGSGGVLAVVGLASVVAVLGARRLGDFDLPWHLAFGRVVVAVGEIPATDPLAFTARPIQYAEVVSDLLLWASYRAGGPLGLQLLGAVVVGAVALVLTVRGGAAARGTVPGESAVGESAVRESADSAATRGALGTWAAPLATALALGAMNPWLIVRPALFSFLLLALELWLLEQHRQRPRERRRALLLLVPLSALWANVHGFVVVGLLVAWLYGSYRGACWIARGRAGGLLPVADRRDAGHTLAVVAVATVAAWLNPAGPHLLLGPLRAASDFGSVTEWATPDFAFLTQTEPPSGMLLVALLLALALGRDAVSGRRLPSLLDLGVVAVAVALAASAVRLIPVAAVMVAPLVARRLAPLAEDRPAMRLVGALGALLVIPWLLMRTEAGLGVGFDPKNHPEGAVRWIEQHQPIGRMWNFSPFGGYLSLRLHPRYQVLIDGRTGWVHDPALVARVRASERDLGELRRLMAELRLEWAVSRAVEGEPFGVALAKAPELTMTYLDDVSAIYVRRDGPNAPLAEQGYRILRHDVPPALVIGAAARGGRRAADLAHDGALAAAQDPMSARAAFFDACGQLALRDRPGFGRALATLSRLAPGNPAVALLEGAWQQAVQR